LPPARRHAGERPEGVDRTAVSGPPAFELGIGGNMSDRHFHGDPARLRAPERVARLEVHRVVAISLEGLAAASVLDVGTGTGMFAEAFASQGLQVTGVDLNPEMIEAAGKLVPGARFQEAAAERLPFADGSFDLVFLGHVLHESDEPARALAEAKRVAVRRVVILEWPYREEEQGPPLAHRLPPERIESLLREQGFPLFERMTLRHVELYRATI
jgi:ubiquinone/menaquinone biosynthesis C-methylase UbiE